MRDRARQRAKAEAMSHRASPDELRDAGKRVKELEQELLLAVPLQPETKLGEERQARYSRVLRLRGLRDDFLRMRPLQTDHPSGMLLAIIMAVASFMLCGFCAGGTLVGLQVLNYKPSPIDTATAFWQAVETQNYLLVHSAYLSPTLRVQYDTTQALSNYAEPADQYYGLVTNFTLSKEQGDMVQNAVLTYVVTRGTNKAYKATLTLDLFGGAWGIDDLGSSLEPWADKSLPAPPTPTPPAPTPTNTPTAVSGTGALPKRLPGDEFRVVV
jgi:hypothetical protein